MSTQQTVIAEGGDVAPVRVFVAEVGCGSFRIRCVECGQIRGKWFTREGAEKTAANHARYKHSPIFP